MPRLLRPALACLGLLAATAASAAGLKLHVPSPDWRDQVVYFAMTDRFDDGDPSNNDLGAGEFDRADGSRYQGGDLRGLARRIDYVRGLGATALWLTPPVANQWLAPGQGHAGYHGYWAEHFMRVDRHLGTLADYRRLSDRLHRRGMYLVQDIVLNHTGDYFAYRGGWSATDPAAHFERHVGTPPVAAPSQPPFHLNDARDPAQRRAGIYHWTPDVTDYADPTQEQTFQMSGLDDLDTERPAVRRALRRSYGHWIRQVGVDAFRVDTAFYVPPATFEDFLRARDPAAPGIELVARQTGRRRFHVFGEGFGTDKPMADDQARKIERYMTGAGGRPLLPGMLNFPLYGAFNDVFARGRPAADLGHRIASLARLHARPHLMPTFVDNHDVDRFLAGGSVPALKQALLAMMTLPGIPTLYYGTEQGFTEPRASMFAAGHGSGGRDRFDTGAPLYRFIAKAATLRRTHRLFSRGWPTVLQASAAGPGALAYTMAHRGERALVVFNTAEHTTLIDNLPLGVPAGTRLQGLFGLDGTPADRVAGDGGRLSLVLPARGGAVWRLGRAPATTPGAPTASPTLDPLSAEAATGDFTVGGRAPGAASVRLVVDGDLASAPRVVPDADGRWQAVVDTSRMVDPSVTHRVVAWADDGPAAGGLASPAQGFRIERRWAALADVADPAGDDHGPAGTYGYPTDPSYGDRHLMDLQRVEVWGAGGALRIDLTMPALSRVWNPANGFDHVAFTAYLELPGRDGGATVMPLQNAELPAGMRWHVRLRAHGWSNALHSSDGASATNEGTPLSPAAHIGVDAARRVVRFTLPASALGRPASLSGARLYVTTWDYDGGYRALTATPQAWSIGGGDPATGARVMDDSAVITLP
ncbi:alpha-amylase family glycosyl hydrolase [Ideonella sp. A 288]|uniref:alpha-amylase family glycosyl hydrolase n=1 Tax=Ideonella sp. A 288 TaxID=1962181 RepID=UPI000B4A7507|nr:alpha-amylase family glycosyl hydrolase [Ideonella sp. A 288]